MTEFFTYSNNYKTFLLFQLLIFVPLALSYNIYTANLLEYYLARMVNFSQLTLAVFPSTMHSVTFYFLTIFWFTVNSLIVFQRLYKHDIL
jgi:hypothetical protein